MNLQHLPATLTLCLSVPLIPLHADDLTWDAATNTTWDLTSSNWGGPFWNNATPDNAIFGPTGVGTITLGEGISVGDITFNTAGYTLSGSPDLTLSNNSTITANADATISVNMIGSGGLIKEGSGTLLMTQNASFTGDTIINAGTFAMSRSLNGNSEVYINNGATLDLRSTNIFLRTSNSAGITIDGGTLTASGGNHNKFGNITMRNGAVWTTEATAGSYAGENFVIRPNATITVDGTSASTMSAKDGVALESGIVTFDVSDASGDAGADLFVNTELENGGGITKTGSGTMLLTVNNTYTGATTVSEGTLALSGNGAIGNSSAINLQSGAVIDASAANNGLTISSGQSLSGEGTVTGDLTFASGSELIADANTSSALQVNGNLDTSAGSVGVTLVGAGSGPIDILNYSGNYTGTAASDFSLNATTRQALFTSTASSNGKIQLDIGSESKTWNNGAGNGQWDTNASANWTGGSDALFFDYDDVTFGDSGAGTVTLQSNIAVNNMTLSNTSGNDYTFEDLTDGTEVLSIGNQLTLNGSGNTTFNALISSNANIQHNGTGNLTFNSPANQTLNGSLTGTGALVKSGTGTLALTADNSGFTGNTTVTGGTLELQHINATGSGTITNNGDLSFNVAGAHSSTHQISGTGNLTTSNNLTLANGASVNIDGDLRRGRGGNLTIENGANIQIGGLARLSGYNGGQRSTTTITGGSLTVTGEASDNRDSWYDVVQSGGSVTLGSLRSNRTDEGNQGGTGGNSTYTLTGGTLTTGNISGGSGASWSRGINLYLGGGTLVASADFNMNANYVELTGTNGNLTFDTGSHTVGSNYAFTGTGGLIKAGSGTLNVTQNHTYTGGTTINQGTLSIGNGGSLTGSITNNANLAVNGTTNITLNNNISGAGNLNFIGNGTNNSNYVVSGDNSSFTGAINIDGARINVNSSGGNRLGSGHLTIEDGGQLWATGGTLNNSISLRGSGVSENAGDLGAIRFSGGTIAGDLSLNGDTRLTAHTISESGTISGRISGSHGIEKTGAGNLTLSGANTFTGNTLISQGTLTLSSSGSLNNSALIEVASGASFDVSAFASTGYSLTSGQSLAGTGNIVGKILLDDGSMLAPGNSPGTMTFNDALVLSDATILNIDLNGADQTIGSGINDLLTGITDFTLDGILNLSSDTNLFSDASDGDRWVIAEYSGSLTDNGLEFGSLSDPLPAGLSFRVDTSTAGQVAIVASVPEPSSMTLIGLGSLALLLRRKRS
ncbi:autotransporter-associated beta strand repeat-containing protein [Rubritalea tangerina]|uniref:Autotransporter-associated beta strand repeat-containing protein n=1 Tax=Rubritalea tangerina TaxID=430798 RepID=A0ABW4Z7E3_9BACT